MVPGIMYIPLVEQSASIMVWAWEEPVERMAYLVGIAMVLTAFVPFCLFITQVSAWPIQQ